jgi:hypothetical protein
MSEQVDVVEGLRALDKDALGDPLSIETYALVQSAAAEITALRARVAELTEQNLLQWQMGYDAKCRAIWDADYSWKARAEAAEAAAARYRWLRDVACNQLYVTRDGDHACNYMTAADWIDEHPEDFVDCDAAEVQRMKDANTIWRVQIYPNTPVGFSFYCAATLDAAIDAAMSERK